MTRHAANALILDSIAVFLLCLIGWSVMPETHAAPVPEPSVQTIAAQDRPIASYNVADRSLTVSEHAPRETLVCMRGACRLVEEWTGR